MGKQIREWKKTPEWGNGHMAELGFKLTLLEFAIGLYANIQVRKKGQGKAILLHGLLFHVLEGWGTVAYEERPAWDCCKICAV